MSLYDTLRHFADSWGLLFMTLVFLGLVGWTFLPGSRETHRKAANIIFDEERDDVQSR